MEHASTVDVGARKRQHGGINEDSVATTVLENHHRQSGRSVGIFVLGDGVGGEASGDVASFLATTIVRERLTEALTGSGTDVLEQFGIDAAGTEPPTTDVDPDAALSEERIRTAIQDAADAANRAIQEYAREIGARPATTLVVAVYADGVLHYAWVGDSRLYLINAEHGEITQLTRDHAVTNELLERGEIEHEEHARVHEDATAITNVVGGSAHGDPTVDVAFGTAEVYREDRVLLTSDGLVDAYPQIGPLRQKYQRADDTAAVREEIRETLVTDDEIRDVVLSAPGLDAAVTELVEFANERGGKDNLSIALATDPAAPTSPDSLPERGPPTVSGRTTVVDPGDEADGADAGEDGSGSSGADADGAPVEDLPASVDVVSVGEDAEPSAALAIPDEDLIVEVGGTVTLGRGGGDDQPDVRLDVGEDPTVESINTVVEADDDGAAGRVRDPSSSGTYVEADAGEWLLLLSSEGAELHREHGFDPGAAAEQDIRESAPLEDGTAFTLGDPREDDAVTCTFFGSLSAAMDRYADADAGNGTEFQRFLT